jgi:tRNA threonylcarbamoyladenosine biosynthesis protein TsaE
VVIETHSPEETDAAGRRLGAALRPGDVVALHGPLGAGKTVFARGIAQGCGATGYMASPSFIVIREYPGAVRVYHVDLYRLDCLDDVQQLGLEDLMESTGVVIVEWAERAAPVLPSSCVHVNIAFGPQEDDRRLTVETLPSLADRLAALAPAAGR